MSHLRARLSVHVIKVVVACRPKRLDLMLERFTTKYRWTRKICLPADQCCQHHQGQKWGHTCSRLIVSPADISCAAASRRLGVSRFSRPSCVQIGQQSSVFLTKHDGPRLLHPRTKLRPLVHQLYLAILSALGAFLNPGQTTFSIIRPVWSASAGKFYRILRASLLTTSS